MGDRDLDRAYKTCPRRSQNYPARVETPAIVGYLRSIPQINWLDRGLIDG